AVSERLRAAPRRGRALRAAGAPVSAEPPVETHFAALASGAAPSEVTRTVREYLSGVHAHLELLHLGGASGSRVNAVHSDLMDRLVRRLLEYAPGGVLPARRAPPRPRSPRLPQ